MDRKELEEALREAQSLLKLTSEISADGRRMADELAETIKGIAHVQCGAIDERAAEVSARLEALRLKLRAA